MPKDPRASFSMGNVPPPFYWTSQRPHRQFCAQSSAAGTQPEVGAEPCWHAAGFGTESVTPGLLMASFSLASFVLAPHPRSMPLKGVAAMRPRPEPDWMLSQPLITPVSM